MKRGSSFLYWSVSITVLLMGVIFVGMRAIAETSEADTKRQRYGMPNFEECQQCQAKISTTINHRMEALNRRESSIKAKEVDLKKAEERMKAQLKELSDRRDELREAMKDMDETQKAEIQRLTEMFNKMREKQAAGIFEELQKPIAVAVLRKMDRARAAKALAKMKPTTAAELAELISEHPMSKIKKENNQQPAGGQ